jgi:HSP20 family molecular chaperone IbpA
MRNYLTTYNTNGNLFDALDDLFKPVFYDENRDMKTDIKETESGYELDIEMPGFEKKDINVYLENGYLTVSGTKKNSEESKDKNEKYLRKEISESFSRSYYVGDNIAEEDVKAKYDNGILCLNVPKAAQKKIQSHSIAID